MTRTLLVAAALMLAATASLAQTDDAARGRLLFDDTPGTSGINTIQGSCTNCHMNVQNRRIAIGGSAFADITFDTAMTRLVQAIQGLPVMDTFRPLPLQDVRDLATYIADTPKTTATALDFTASAVNSATAAQTVDLRHSVATTDNLVVTGVAIGGANAAQFTLASNACNAATLAPNNTCRIGVTFNAPDTAGKTAALTLNLRQGSVNFSRTVTLTGAVAVSNPPPSDDGGGGALGTGWLVALACAVGALAQRRRDAFHL